MKARKDEARSSSAQNFSSRTTHKLTRSLSLSSLLTSFRSSFGLLQLPVPPPLPPRERPRLLRRERRLLTTVSSRRILPPSLPPIPFVSSDSCALVDCVWVDYMKVQLALSKEQHPEKSHAIRFKEIAKVSSPRSICSCFRCRSPVLTRVLLSR